MSAIKVSLVVCTRNRAQHLARFLDVLTQVVSRHAWEVIMVDSASSDDTYQKLLDYPSNDVFSYKVIQVFQPGTSRAKNAGWKIASGEIIAFTDDDCYLNENYIDALVAEFEKNQLAYLGGRVELYDRDDLPITIKTDTQYQHYPPYRFILPGQVHGANMAFRKVYLEHVDGFDDLLGAGTPYPCEDCDILTRVSLLGVAGAYAPDVLVFHHHRRRTAEDRKKIEASYTLGRGAYYVKALVDHPYKLQTFISWLKSAKYFGLHLWPGEILSGVKYLFARR